MQHYKIVGVRRIVLFRQDGSTYERWHPETRTYRSEPELSGYILDGVCCADAISEAEARELEARPSLVA